jgi:hypothetical protein
VAATPAPFTCLLWWCWWGAVGVAVMKLVLQWWCPNDDLSVVAVLQRLQCQCRWDNGAADATPASNTSSTPLWAIFSVSILS